MLCKAEEKDPRKCINEGKEVTKCGMQFFRKIKANCADSFTAYWKCIDNSSWDMNYNKLVFITTKVTILFIWSTIYEGLRGKEGSS